MYNDERSPFAKKANRVFYNLLPVAGIVGILSAFIFLGLCLVGLAFTMIPTDNDSASTSTPETVTTTVTTTATTTVNADEPAL